MVPIRSQDGPKIVPRLSQNGTKIVPRYSQDGPEILKIVPRLSKNGTKICRPFFGVYRTRPEGRFTFLSPGGRFAFPPTPLLWTTVWPDGKKRWKIQYKSNENKRSKDAEQVRRGTDRKLGRSRGGRILQGATQFPREDFHRIVLIS